MPQEPSLAPHPSEQHAAWQGALHGGDDALLEQLASGDEPAAALFELETYINGIYRASQHPLFSKPMPDVRYEVRRVLPYADEIRSRAGWRIREFDVGLLRLIRRSSALSPVLGAGVSMGAGAPSWPDLVRLMLEETLEKGLEISGEAKRYTAEQEQTAREVLAEVKAKGFSTDVERLMQGAQVCYDLCGQHLFNLLTRLLYTRAKEPSETHRAIAELAHAQNVPARGPGLFPGWDSIITYNIDALMSEALTEQKVPHAAWAMRGDELRGDPDELARKSPWHQPVFHIHGYTPRRLFLITDVRYVFSTSQYLTTYKGPRSRILETVHGGFLANPVHVAIYAGCSFTDEAMNGLLREAFAGYPGRYHYAFLKWPRDRKGREPGREEMEAESAKHLEFGVRPVWFDDFKELPGLIRQLQ
ncbi:MAG: SIR2 family protein [Acidobacteriota bacterium]